MEAQRLVRLFCDSRYHNSFATECRTTWKLWAATSAIHTPTMLKRCDAAGRDLLREFQNNIQNNDHADEIQRKALASRYGPNTEPTREELVRIITSVDRDRPRPQEWNTGAGNNTAANNTAWGDKRERPQQPSVLVAPVEKYTPAGEPLEYHGGTWWLKNQKVVLNENPWKIYTGPMQDFKTAAKPSDPGKLQIPIESSSSSTVYEDATTATDGGQESHHHQHSDGVSTKSTPDGKRVRGDAVVPQPLVSQNDIHSMFAAQQKTINELMATIVAQQSARVELPTPTNLRIGDQSMGSTPITKGAGKNALPEEMETPAWFSAYLQTQAGSACSPSKSRRRRDSRDRARNDSRRDRGDSRRRHRRKGKRENGRKKGKSQLDSEWNDNSWHDDSWESEQHWRDDQYCHQNNATQNWNQQTGSSSSQQFFPNNTGYPNVPTGIPPGVSNRGPIVLQPSQAAAGFQFNLQPGNPNGQNIPLGQLAAEPLQQVAGGARPMIGALVKPSDGGQPPLQASYYPAAAGNHGNSLHDGSNQGSADNWGPTQPLG